MKTKKLVPSAWCLVLSAKKMLAIALCAVGLAAMAVEPADTVVYGTIRTAETDNPAAEAIAIKDGKYVYVGDEAGAAAFVKDGVTKVIDHRGKGMVMPGCTDGHSHYTMKFGLANMKGGILFGLNDNKTNVLKKVEESALTAQAAGKTCILGFGWNLANLRVKDTPPTLKEFDDITHGLSMVIFAHGGHHAYCNSECLKRCGIIDGKGNVLIKEIPGGLLELDEKGYPTGFVDERVTGYLTRMGGINYDEIVDDEVAEASIRASQELLLSTGYTTALEGWSNTLHPSNFYVAAHRMDANGTLKLVFPMTYEVEPWQTNMTEQIDYLDSLNKTYRSQHVLPEYLKVFMDGCVESMTGAMLKPYTDKDKTVYKSFWSVDRLAGITANCNARGLTVHTHTMGDAAVKEVTDAYIKANELSGDSAYRNCLVHLRHVSTDDFKRFADNNIACSAGFTWHVSIKEVDDLLKNFLDEEYIKHAYPMKSFFDAGVRVSSHSDFPANEPSPQDPFGIMQVALTGLLPDSVEKPFDTDELVTVEQVFQALTINGAWQLGLENERGSIKVGKWADFVLTDRDVFECATTDIHKTKVVSTWFEGEMVYPLPQPIAAESDEFTVDLRTRVEFEEGKTRIDGVTWSATAWGAIPGSKYTDLGYENKTTGATGVIAEGLVGENLDDCPLPEKDGEYVLKHTTGDLKSFVTFVVSGYPLGCESNPWTVGPADDPDSTVAWKDGKDAIVYLKPPRSAVSRAGLETLTNAMGGVSFDMMLVTADGTATNDVKMIIGASGTQYKTLEEMLESDEDFWTFFDITGCVVSYDGMGHSGTMAPDTFLPGIPTNLTANAYTAFGYTFQGWTTNGDTKVVFKDKAKIDDPQPGDIYDLKAVWKLTPVSVGSGVTACLDENGTLHIKGKGKMKDFTAANPAPWAEFAADIKAIEVEEGVTKIGNAAFAELDYKATTTALTFQDEDHVLNLLAFVSADGSKTNAPLAKAFSVYKDSSGTVEPIVAFQTLDLVYVWTKAPTLMRYGYDEVRLLTLPDLKAVQTAELIETAGETPYSKTMQGLLDEALDKIDKATNFDEVMDGYAKRLAQIKAQAAKDKTNEIKGEGYDITWRVMDGELAINGEGKMPDFVAPAFTNGAPWNVMKDDITNATVAAGITSLGDAAFAISPAFAESSVLFKDPALELNLGAFVSGDGSLTNVPTVRVEIETEDGRTLRVIPGGWTDADDPNVTYDSLAEAIEDGAVAVVAAFVKETDAGEKTVPPAEVEEVVKTVSDPDDPEKKIELTAAYENNPTAEGSTAGLVSEIENLPAIVIDTCSNITVIVTATNKDEVAVEVVKKMDGAMSNDCEIVKAILAPDVETKGFDSSYLDMSAFFSFKNDSGRLVEFTQSVIAHIPMKLYDGQIYSVSRRHRYGTEWVTEVLTMWHEGIDADEDVAATNEWVKVDVANQELVVKTRRFCDYALGELELAKTCAIYVNDGEKKLGEADPKSLATNVEIVVTGPVNKSDFVGYAKRAAGEACGEYPINYIMVKKMPTDFPADKYTVHPGVFTIVMGEKLPAGGTVTNPKAASASTGLIKMPSTATWKAKANVGSVFAGWTWHGSAGKEPAAFAALSSNELKKTTLSVKIAAGELVRPTYIRGNWARIDEDLIESVMIDTNGLYVATKSYVTATVSGLPSGLKFNTKTLAITGAVKAKDKTYKVKVSVKNASGYTWKQTFDFVVAGNAVTEVVPADDCVTTGVPVMVRCDPAMGKVTGTGVYALGKDGTKRVSINATALSGYVFAGWYEDPGFSRPASFTTGTGTSAKPKDYREASQSVTVTGPTYLFARFVEKTTKADPITHLRFLGAGYCGADASEFAEEETWYQGVALPADACQIAFGSASLPTVTVSGLPSGVKFDKTTCRFTGVPTVASTEKKPFFTVKISVKNKSGATDVLTKYVTVEALPAWAVGNFDGYHMEKGVTNGTFQATVGKTGKVSGKTVGGLASTTFSAANFSGVELVDGELCYVADVTVSYKDPSTKKTVKATDTLYLMENPETGLGTIGGGDRDGCGCVGVQRAWDRKDLAYPAFDTKALKDPLVLDNGITLKFGAKGKVTVAGKVTGDDGNLITVSGSTYVLPFMWTDERQTNLVSQTCVYIAPKKNLADGICEVYNVRLTVGETSKFVLVKIVE